MLCFKPSWTFWIWRFRSNDCPNACKYIYKKISFLALIFRSEMRFRLWIMIKVFLMHNAVERNQNKICYAVRFCSICLFYLPCYINCICEFSFHHEYFVYVSWGYPKLNRLVGKNHTQNLFVLHVQLFCGFEVDKIGRMFFHKGHSYSLLFFRELAWCEHSNWPC